MVDLARSGTVCNRQLAMTATRARVSRLYVEQDLGGPTLVLDDRETHYLAHVLRLKRGDRLVAFNGRGAERHASIHSLTKRSAELELLADAGVLPESPLELTLVQALPKAEAMDLIVQKATELGVRRIVPVYSDFSVVKLDSQRRERRLEHWQRVARSACEQCGRHTPPEVETAAPLSAYLAHDGEHDGPALALEPDAALRLARIAPVPHAARLFVGPEGGWSPSDLARLDAAGATRVGMGPRVLRAETAAIAACAAAQALWGEL